MLQAIYYHVWMFGLIVNGIDKAIIMPHAVVIENAPIANTPSVIAQY